MAKRAIAMRLSLAIAFLAFLDPSLAFCAMVAESGCRALDVRSRKGAVGFWQLMPATARAHGCNDPADLDCATRAAASYLKDLSRRFSGDDIIAAYSMGGYNLARRGMTAEARGLIQTVRELERQDKESKNANSD